MYMDIESKNLVLIALLALLLLSCSKAANRAGGDDRDTATTTASPSAGKYREPLSVELNCDDQRGSGCAVTHYTLDGTEPTGHSPVYASPIPIDTDTVIKFYSIDDAGNQEATVTQQYIFDRIRPTYESSTPPEGGHNVSLMAAKIRVKFNEEINPNTLDTSSFSIHSRAGPIMGSVEYEADTHTAIFSVNEPLAPGNLYTVKLNNSITDSAGNVLEAYEFSFHSATVAWAASNGNLIKLTSAQEEILRIEQIDCLKLGSRLNMAVDRNSNALWVVDTDHNRVIKLDEGGELLALLPLNSPVGLALDANDGSAWVTVDSTISGEGRKLVLLTTLGTPLIETQAGLSFTASIPGSLNPITFNTNTRSLSLVNGIGDASNYIASQHMYIQAKPSELDNFDIITAFVDPSAVHQYFIGRGGSKLALAEMNNVTSLWAGIAPGQLQKYAEDGSVILESEVAHGVGLIHYLSGDVQNGGVWAADENGNVVKVAVDGKVVVTQAGYSAPFGDITADSLDGGAWIGFSGGVAKLAANGAEEWRITATPVQAITVQRDYGLTLFVDNSANPPADTGQADITEIGTRLNPFHTIQAALDASANRDTILVSAGEYDGFVRSDRGGNIKLMGSASGVTKLTSIEKASTISLKNFKHVTISHFTLSGSAQTSENVLRCFDCLDVLIRRNRIDGSIHPYNFNGIELSGTANRPESANGVPFVDFPYPRGIIEQNYVGENQGGTDFGAGISVSFAHTWIRNNLIVKNAGAGIDAGDNDNITMITNNTIEGNAFTGMSIESNAKVVGNIIANNTLSNSSRAAGGIYFRSESFSRSGVLYTLDFEFNNVINNSANGVTADIAIDRTVDNNYGVNTISVEPGYRSPVFPEYRLLPDSPLVNAGPPGEHPDASEACDSPNRRSDLGAYGGPRGNW